MEQRSCQAYFTISNALEVVGNVPTNIINLNKNEISQEVKSCENWIQFTRTAYTQAVLAHRSEFQEPIIGIYDLSDRFLLQKALDALNDNDLKNRIFNKPKGLFARKLTYNEYDYFCKAAKYIEAYYENRLMDLQKCIRYHESVSEEIGRQLAVSREIAMWNIDPDPASWREYKPAYQSSGELFLGDLEFPVDAEMIRAFGLPQQAIRPDSLQAGAYCLKLPFSYNVFQPFACTLLYEGDKKRGEELLGTILRNTVYQIIHAMPTYSYEIIYLDSLRAGAGLKEINRILSPAVDGNAYRLHSGLYEDFVFRPLKVRGTAEGVRQQKAALEERLAAISTICGGISLVQYNSMQFDGMGRIMDGGPGVIPQSFVFANLSAEELENEKERSYWRKLKENAKDAGISIFLTAALDRVDERRDPEAAQKRRILVERFSEMTDLIHMEGPDAYNDNQPQVTAHFISYDNPLSSSSDRNGTRCFYEFSPYVPLLQQENFLQLVLSAYEPSPDVDVMFEHRMDIDALWGKGDASHVVQMPVGVNERNDLVSFTLGDNNGYPHGMVAGAAGSGKSTFLHGLINSVIVQYKPSDVQMWLADYKKVEFRRYIQNTPPHIGFVAAANSQEFSFAFLQKIYDEHQRRMMIFSTCSSLSEYRSLHGEDSLPRLLVIIDEFHVLSNHIKDHPEYKQMLSDILREARGVGIMLLLSDQTCGVGLKGLTEDGKLQITRRMAMNTSVDEYNSVFDITNARDVIAQQQKFQITIQNLRNTRDKYGRDVTLRYYEKCNTLNIESRIRDEIATRSIQSYGPAKSPVFITEFDRLPVDNTILAAIKADNLATFAEDEGYQIYLGAPLGIQKFAKFRMQVHRGRENLCVSIPDVGMLSSLLISILSSLFLAPDSEICILANPYDPVYRRCSTALRELQRTHDNIKVYTELTLICEQISGLSEEMTKRRKQSHYASSIHIIWLGLDEILSDMSYYPEKKPVSLNRRREKSVSDMLDELEASFLNLNLIDSDTGAAIHPSFDIVAREPETESEDMEDLLYNAAEEIRQLGIEGPKRDMHNYLFYLDVRSAYKQRTLQLDECRHKIAAGISKEDATDFFGSSKTILDAEGKIRDKDTAIYSDSRDSQAFMPYIHGCVEKKAKGGTL